jgi:hypothetical protein
MGGAITRRQVRPTTIAGCAARPGRPLRPGGIGTSWSRSSRRSSRAAPVGAGRRWRGRRRPVLDRSRAALVAAPTGPSRPWLAPPERRSRGCEPRGSKALLCERCAEVVFLVRPVKFLVSDTLWGGRDLNPRPEDYEHSGPERCAVRRIPLVKSEGRPPNTLLFRGSPLSKINYRPESPITRNVESLNIPSGPVRDVSRPGS